MPTLVKDRAANLQNLIEELLKERPNKEKIKDLMNQSGLKYTSDPIEQMSTVLSMMQSTPIKMKKEKVQEV